VLDSPAGPLAPIVLPPMALPPLSPEQQIKPRGFELRMSAMFWALFVPVGVHVPYFPLWLEAKGFDAAQIAVILSAPHFLRLVTTPYITSFADRAPDRVYVLMVMIAATLVLSCGYFLEPRYWVVLAVSVALHVFWSPHAPLSDSIALSGVRRFGLKYPRMRVWGSLAFLASNFFGGVILSYTGPEAVPAIIAAGLAAALVMSLFIPRVGRPRQPSPLSAAEIRDAGSALFNRHFVLLVAAAGVIHSSHTFLFSFGSIYWKSIGISDSVIGALWASAVMAEVCMFVVFTRVLGRVSAAHLFYIAGAAAVVRWVAFPLVWPSGIGVAGFFATQALHALSTALVLLGVQKLIAETFGDEKTGAAQGVAFFANGLAFALVTLASGPIYGHFGVNGFFVIAGVAIVGIALVATAGLTPQRGLRR